jgi:hypothetical protein
MWELIVGVMELVLDYVKGVVERVLQHVLAVQDHVLGLVEELVLVVVMGVMVDGFKGE